MLRPVPPMSNAERQRNFRASHPGYRNRFRQKPDPAHLVALMAEVQAKNEAARQAEHAIPREWYASA